MLKNFLAPTSKFWKPRSPGNACKAGGRGADKNKHSTHKHSTQYTAQTLATMEITLFGDFYFSNDRAPFNLISSAYRCFFSTFLVLYLGHEIFHHRVALSFSQKSVFGWGRAPQVVMSLRTHTCTHLCRGMRLCPTQIAKTNTAQHPYSSGDPMKWER